MGSKFSFAARIVPAPAICIIYVTSQSLNAFAAERKGVTADDRFFAFPIARPSSYLLSVLVLLFLMLSGFLDDIEMAGCTPLQYLKFSSITSCLSVSGHCDEFSIDIAGRGDKPSSARMNARHRCQTSINRYFWCHALDFWRMRYDCRNVSSCIQMHSAKARRVNRR